MSYRISRCPLCGGEEFRFVLRARDFHYGNPGEFTLVECARCTLAFLDPMYDDAELAAFYPQNYYAYADRFSVKHYSLHRRFLRWLLGIREFETKDPHFDKPGRMLDIGCGSGWFIDGMRRKGWQVTGVEPSADAAAFGRKEKGLDILHGSLLDTSFPPRSFNYIRLNHSFEHMNNPNSVLDEIHRILADDGRLMIGVPNRASFNARVFGPCWYHLALPLHTFSWSPRTLCKMLEKHSFRPLRVLYNTDNAGLQGSIQFFLNRKTQPARPTGIITESQIARVLTVWGAFVQNLLHVADLIEVTAVKQ